MPELRRCRSSGRTRVAVIRRASFGGSDQFPGYRDQYSGGRRYGLFLGRTGAGPFRRGNTRTGRPAERGRVAKADLGYEERSGHAVARDARLAPDLVGGQRQPRAGAFGPRPGRDGKSVGRPAAGRGEARAYRATGTADDLAHSLDNRDPAAQCVVDLGHLQTDDSAADDEQPLGDVLQRERAGAVKDPGSFGQKQQAHWFRPAGDDGVLNADRLGALGRGHAPRSRSAR